MRAFAEVSAVTEREGGGVFDADIDPQWTIGGRPNGGYLLAILARAAVAVCPHEHVVAASATYLRPPAPGPAEVRTKVLRAGRSASQVRATLAQDGAACVEAVLTVATLDASATPFWDRGIPAPRTRPIGECVRVPGVTPGGVHVAINEQVEVRLDPEDMSFARGAPSGRGEVHGWLTLPGGDTFDPLSLLYAVDALPPATFEIAPSGWVPTLELTAYVRALPAPGPVWALQKAQLVEAGRVDEACYVWDGTGRLVAHGTQLAGIRLS